MGLNIVDQPPKEIIEFDDLEGRLTKKHVDDVIEIFNTPLTGSYNWDYHSADGRIRKLYELGKELNWNAGIDVDWSIDFPKTEFPTDEMFNPFVGYAPYEAMSEEEKLKFAWHNQAWDIVTVLAR